MMFPEVERVIYKKNPLTQVICQFKYPTILRIDAQEPFEFQEEIRTTFPIFQDKQEDELQIPKNILQNIPSELVNLVGRGNTRNYEFLTEDKVWKVNLTRDFVALSTVGYENWEQFNSYLQQVFDNFVKIYKPAYFTRIGLRYQNVIQRSSLSLGQAEWIELLNSYILGLLSNESTYSSIVETITRSNIVLEDIDSKIGMQYGLAKHNPSGEICYLLDNDFYTEKRTEVENGRQILNEFNQRNRRLFRWCITNRLHEAMEPNRS